MKINDLFTRSMGGLGLNRSRTVFTTLSITVASFSLTMAIGIVHGGSAYVQKTIDTVTEPQTLWVMKKQDDNGAGNRPSKYTGTLPLRFNDVSVQPISADDLQKIRSTKGVTSIRPYIAIENAYVSVPDQDNYQAVVTEKHPNDPVYLLAGEMTGLQNDETILADGYREALGFATSEDAVGQTVSVTVLNVSGPKMTQKKFDLKVRAVVREANDVLNLAPSSLRVTEPTAKQMNQFVTDGTPMKGKYIALSAKINNPDQLQSTKQILANRGYEAQDQHDTDKGLSQFLAVFQMVMILFGVTAVIAAVIGIVNTQYMSVAERVQEVGLMKALGMTKNDVGTLFRIEAGLIGFFGGCIGVILAVIAGYSLDPLLIRIALLDPDTLILRFLPLDGPLVIIGLTIIATLAGLAPAKRASNLDPIDALRSINM